MEQAPPSKHPLSASTSFKGRGLYMYWKIPPPPPGGISADVIWGINKKENEKRGSKMVKYFQNREELRQKGHDGSRKTMCRERVKNTYHFQKGGGNKYCFLTEI
jgi:hypothetical protein